MDRSRIAVVIPALNEAESIAVIVRQLATQALVVVVDDGSSDATHDSARKAGAEVVRHVKNRGYDMALQTGFERAATLGCDYIVTMDADGQHAPELLTRFVDELELGADVVIGVRDRKQRFSEHAFAVVATWLWGVHDPLCGMKAYRLEIYRMRGYFDSYGSIGTELALFAARRGRRIVQVPVATRPRLDTPRFGRGVAANLRIFRALVLSLRPLHP